MPSPLTDMDKVFAVRGELRQFFEGQGDLVGFQLFPTTPKPRLMVKRGLKEQAIYPMWADIDAVLDQNGNQFKNFEGVVILGGIGMGYLAEAITQKLGHFATLAIWEPDPEWLRAACYLRDLTDLFINRQVQLIIGGEIVLRQYVESMYGQLALNVTTVVDSCLGDLYPDRRHMLDEVVTPMIKAQEGNRSTLIAFGEKFFINAMRSLPALAESQTVTVLKDTTPHIPAIIIGAGPGLTKHLDTLKRAISAPNTAMIFAADTAIDLLLDHGIVPNFVVSVDPQEETARKYEAIEIPPEVALIYHPGAHYTIAQNFKGRKFVCPSMIQPLDRFHSLLPPDRVGNQIQCQVQLAFDAAKMMGCSPIILLGIDLCYTGVDGMYAKNPPHLAGFEQEVFDRAWPTVDMRGAPVFMNSQFDQYRTGFAERARHTRTINANEQGLSIPNTIERPFATVLSEECGVRFIDWPRLLHRTTEQPYPVKASVLLDRLRPLLKDWRFYQMVARHVVRTIAKERTQTTRNLVCRWMNKLVARPGSLDTLLLLEQYGHTAPRPIRQVRLPALVDRIQYEAEWVQTRMYCEWLERSAGLAYEEGCAVERQLSEDPHFTVQGQT